MKIEQLQKRLQRERLRREEAERLLETKARELYEVNRQLSSALAQVEERVQLRTAELEAAKASAERADRAKTRFLAMMSHEIRTPLNGLLGMLTLLYDTNLDSDQKRLVETAQRSGRGLLEISKDILDYSLIEEGRVEIKVAPFELREVIREAQELTRLEADRKGLAVSFLVNDAVAACYLGDAGRIRQVLVNLLSNAVKYTDAGGVDVVVTSSKIDGETDDVRISVKDTGVGIAEENQKLAFREYSTFGQGDHNDVSSVGLGLAICKNLVLMMGGSIGLASQEGVGSTFSFSLPLMKGALLDKSSSDSHIARNKLIFLGSRILIAEDNKTNQIIVRRFLESVGCDVDVAENGKEAVLRAETSKYSAILMDVSMPVMDGVCATRLIREGTGVNKQTPIVGLTAHVYPEDEKRFRSAGMQLVLAKPVSRPDLFGRLSELIAPDDAGKKPGAVTPVFDRSVLEALLRDRNGDEQIRLLGQICEDLDDCRSTVSTAIAQQDIGLLEEVSHKLQGLGGVFGALELTEHAQKANEDARKSAIESVWASAEGLRVQCDAVIDEMNYRLKQHETRQNASQQH